MTDAMTPTVFVLLPVHNRRDLTQRFLESLRSQTYPQIRLIVIDDGSIDGTGELVKRAYPAAVLIRGDGAWWWAGCLQRGFEWLSNNVAKDEDVVLMINDDTTFDPDYIAMGVHAHNEAPHSFLGSRIRDPETCTVRESGVDADLRRFVFRIAETSERINCLPTRGLFVRWGDVKRIGGFHPRLLPHYWSDYEFTVRAHRVGVLCRTSPSVALTANPDTTGNHDLDALVGWYFMRSFFSIKTPLNPLYRTSFAMLACPGVWKLINVLNIWTRAGFRIIWQGILHQRFPRKAVTRGLA